MLRVVVADDSDTNRQLLVHIINQSDDLRVIGQATDGKRAVRMVAQLQPDVVLMDVVMPEMDGLEATREIMMSTPTPIVMISAGIAGRETEVGFQALRQGALTLLSKPVSPVDADFNTQADQIIRTLRAMANVHVIHHHKERRKPARSKRLDGMETGQPAELVAIASSTGGPAALARILPELPSDFNKPIVIVQHIAADFVPSLVKWLSGLTPQRLGVAEHGDAPQPGHIYIAPGDHHLAFADDGTFHLQTTPKTYHMPSADIFFESVARVYGASTIGVILTGMGTDGAQGLYKLYMAGGMTIAQDEATSAVFGMPAEAARIGAAEHVLPLNDIANMLYSLQKI